MNYMMDFLQEFVSVGKCDKKFTYYFIQYLYLYYK